MVGRVKWLIDPDYRGVGLGTLLINHFIGIAATRGLRHLTCMLISELEADAIRVLRGARLPFLRGSRATAPIRTANQHDMTLMVCKL